MNFLEQWHWALQAFGIIFLALLADYTQRRLLRRAERRLTEATQTIWDEAVVGAARQPLTLLIWVLGISFATDIGRHTAKSVIFEAIPPIRDLGVVTAITWFVVRLVRRGEEAMALRATTGEMKIDPTTVDAVGKLMRISVFITAGLVSLQTLGFSISGVLAFGGIGGIAVGFAARDLLANFFGGLMIFLDRPFSVGDWVRSPDRQIEGVVEEISWRLTHIRTFDKRPLYVPNSTFSTITLENPSRMQHRRIYETVGIRYDDVAQMGPIVSAVESMLAKHPDIAQEQMIMVNFNSFAPSSLDFFLYCFTKTTDWATFHQVKQDVLLKVADIVADHGAEIAFPTSTVHVPAAVSLFTEEERTVKAPLGKQRPSQ